MASRLDRPPGASDDASAGYAPGNLWRHGTMIRRCISDTPGAAVWQPVVRPGDGAAVDIGFNADGARDTLGLDALLDGASGRVAIWYDQSGNGHDAKQADPMRCPAICISNLAGNARSIMSDSPVHNPTVRIGLTIPPEVAGMTNAMSILTVSRFASTAGTSALFQPNAAPGGRDRVRGNSRSGSCTYWAARPGTAVSSRTRTAQTAMVNGLILGAAGPRAIRMFNGESSSDHTSINATPLAGGTSGFAAGNGTHCGVKMSAVLIYDRELEPTAQTDITASLRA